mmetsp:Transcript_68388/g.160340  ORF Transcript_68388/g.160340 Transcript_68388/m.160340 type:complete len:348 (+) Transcript_68388:4418-5461(+)
MAFADLVERQCFVVLFLLKPMNLLFSLHIVPKLRRRDPKSLQRHDIDGLHDTQLLVELGLPGHLHDCIDGGAVTLTLSPCRWSLCGMHGLQPFLGISLVSLCILVLPNLSHGLSLDVLRKLLVLPKLFHVVDPFLKMLVSGPERLPLQVKLLYAPEIFLREDLGHFPPEMFKYVKHLKPLLMQVCQYEDDGVLRLITLIAFRIEELQKKPTSLILVFLIGPGPILRAPRRARRVELQPALRLLARRVFLVLRQLVRLFQDVRIKAIHDRKHRQHLHVLSLAFPLQGRCSCSGGLGGAKASMNCRWHHILVGSWLVFHDRPQHRGVPEDIFDQVKLALRDAKLSCLIR